jgi:1-hydroxycarotenoid 3,4-desaturase
LLQISPFTSLAQELDKHFRDPRLKQLFGRYATYCGSSPFDAPATLMLVAHVEQQGVWVIQGGMYCLALAMEKIARAQGVRFRYDTEAREILLKRTTVSGLRCNTTGRDEVLEFDAVIANTDANAVANGALGAALRNATATVPEAARSLSAVTWMLSTKASGFPLHRHNVFFSRDYRREFNDIFDSRRLPNEPTVYVCAQDRDEQGQTTTIHERFLILINAPPTGDVPQNPAFSPEEIHRCEETIFKLLGRCGLRMEPTAPAMVTTPTEWHQLFPETGGALYGRASHGWMASFRRPAARTKIPGLYLAGGSVHPGPGMAMAALSGRQAAKAVLTDQRSTRSWHAMATYGGT